MHGTHAIYYLKYVVGYRKAKLLNKLFSLNTKYLYKCGSAFYLFFMKVNSGFLASVFELLIIWYEVFIEINVLYFFILFIIWYMLDWYLSFDICFLVYELHLSSFLNEEFYLYSLHSITFYPFLLPYSNIKTNCLFFSHAILFILNYFLNNFCSLIPAKYK